MSAFILSARRAVAESVSVPKDGADVVIYKTASTTAAKAGSLKAGASAELVATSGTFFKIKAGAVTGFVLQSKVKKDTAVAAEPKKKTCRCRSVVDSKKTDVAGRWLDHFTIYELTADDDKFVLGDKVSFLDVSSKLIVERTSSLPEEILPSFTENEFDDEAEKRAEKKFCLASPADPRCTKASQDEADEADEATMCANDNERSCADSELRNDGVDIDVVAWRTDNCFERIALDGLHYSDFMGFYVDLVKQPSPKCGNKEPATLQTYTGIKKGAVFPIPDNTLVPGRRVEVNISGNRIADEVVATNCKEADGKRTCDIETKTTWGDVVKRSFLPVDFSSIRPMEVSGRRLRPIFSTRTRVDTAHDIVFRAPRRLPLAFGTTEDAKFDVVVHVEVTGKDGAVRPGTVSMNDGHPVLTGLKDGDTVKVRIVRKVQKGEAVSWREIHATQFRAAALGLRWAPTGEYKGSYSTSSAFALRLRSTSDGAYGFAQTFAYSFSWRTREPSSLLDNLSLGFHIAVLATETESPSEHPLTLGIGGQLTFGGDILHLGAGYDPRNEDVYALIGLSLQELADLLQGKQP